MSVIASATRRTVALCLLLALFAADEPAQASTTHYCAPELCPKEKIHTACKQHLLTWSFLCEAPNKALSVVTETDKAAIVDYHNELRRKVAKGLETRRASGAQPSASNMRKLVWNQEIADIAQTHAQTCVSGRDQCRNIPGMYVGQNSVVESSHAPSPFTNVTWKGAIDDWYSEVDYVTSSIVKCFFCSLFYEPPHQLGHYTQLVWATTTQIGCGVSSYRGQYGFYYVFYVCNYGPGGNIGGDPVYKIGAPASACPTGTTPQDGLCA